MWRAFLPLLLPLLTFGAVVAASGSDPDTGDGRMAVVATTSQAADFARQVGGRRVSVSGLLAPNADPHGFEVRSRDVKALARAAVVVRSGGDLDEWLGGAIEASGTRAPTVTLADAAAAPGDDPHWWQDPRRARRAVAALGAAMAAADPTYRAHYERRAAAYAQRLERLDRAVAACLAQVPTQQRTLVTTHDALGFYAQRYGIRVIGTVIPSRSTLAQPSAGEVDALVTTIRREGVRAIFAESSVEPRVEAAIARETGARVGRALWADTLGPPGSDGATYVESIAANTAALVDGFTGGRVACTPRA